MKYGRYGYSYLLLRLGLGLTFIWIGIDMFRHPALWIGYLPVELPFNIAREVGLDMAAVFDIALGLLLMAGNFPHFVALLAVLHIAGILVIHRVDAVLIRDVGLLGAALALLFWPTYRHKSWWQRWRGGKNGGAE